MNADQVAKTVIDQLADRYGTPTVPAKPAAPTVASSSFDPLGRTLTVDDHKVDGDKIIRLRVESDTRLHVQAFELDADDAISLAHDLLERAYTDCDCDEIETAVSALRALADREARYIAVGESMAGEDR